MPEKKELTLKQETACQAYIETQNKSAAYRRGFNCQNMKPETINRKAKEFFDRDKIRARCDVLLAPAVAAAQMTVEGHLKELATLRDLAKKEGKYAAAVKAEESRGKVAGFYKERIELSGQIAGAAVVMTAEEYEKTLERLRANV